MAAGYPEGWEEQDRLCGWDVPLGGKRHAASLTLRRDAPGPEEKLQPDHAHGLGLGGLLLQQRMAEDQGGVDQMSLGHGQGGGQG